MKRFGIHPTDIGAAALAVEAASRYAAKLRRYIDHRLYKNHDVDDLEQEVYLRLLQADCPTDLKNPLAFIYTVASRVIGDYWRDSNSKTEQLHSTGPDLQLIFDNTSDPSVNLEEKLSAEQTVRLALQNLSPMHAAILVLVDRDRMTHIEAAQELDISVHTVKKYLTQARSSLRKKYGNGVPE